MTLLNKSPKIFSCSRLQHRTVLGPLVALPPIIHSKLDPQFCGPLSLAPTTLPFFVDGTDTLPCRETIEEYLSRFQKQLPPL
jgi:hypothetical protein